MKSIFVFGSLSLLFLSSSFIQSVKAWRKCPPRTAYPTFSGNVSFADNDLDLSFRASSAFAISLPFQPGGLGVYSSIATELNQLTASFDAFAARLSASQWVPPSAATGWFATSASLQGNLNKTDIDASAYAGVFTSAMASVFLNAIEYYDTNGDGVFDPENGDIQVQTISLASQQWDNVCASENTDDPNDPITSFNITTKPIPWSPLVEKWLPYLNFSIQATISDVVGVTDSNVLLTPKTVKIDLSINDFPYKGYNGTKNTKLALETVVISAQANATVNLEYDGQRIHTGDGPTAFQLSWVNTATVNGQANTAVRTSGFSSYAGFSTDLGLVIYNFFSGYVSAGLDIQFKKIYFCFDGVQPSAVYWDPSIVSGKIFVPDDSTSSAFNATAVTLGVVFGFLGLLLFAYLIYRYRSLCCRSSSEKDQLLSSQPENYSQAPI